MSVFGGFSGGMPFRLTGNRASGWSAAQYLRLCQDTISARRALPFAVMTFTRTASVISDFVWKSQAPDTEANEPAFSFGGTTITITFPKAPTDEADDAQALNIRSVNATWHSNSSKPRCSVTAPNVVTVNPGNTDVTLTVVVYANWNEPSLGDYGAYTDKANCDTEATPYAWLWYQEIGASLGSAFGGQMTGLVHSRKLAVARAFAGLSRHEEAARAASTPHTAHPNVATVWASALSVPVSSDDTDADTRTAIAARFAAKSGQDLVDLELAVSELLGNRYVGISTFTTNDDSAWPSTYDIGGGVWASTRSKILVDVISPASVSDPEFDRLMNVQFVRLMDRLTPAWVWFNWTDTTSGGFFLDVSRLDYTGF